MSKRIALPGRLSKDLKKKVRENLAGHNLSVTSVSNDAILATCIHQESKPVYTVIAGNKAEVQKKIKHYRGAIIPTSDKEVAIIAHTK